MVLRHVLGNDIQLVSFVFITSRPAPHWADFTLTQHRTDICWARTCALPFAWTTNGDTLLTFVIIELGTDLQTDWCWSNPQWIGNGSVCVPRLIRTLTSTDPKMTTTDHSGVGIIVNTGKGLWLAFRVRVRIVSTIGPLLSCFQFIAVIGHACFCMLISFCCGVSCLAFSCSLCTDCKFDFLHWWFASLMQ